MKPVAEDCVGKSEMNDQHDVTKLTPAEEDPVLHRHIAAMPAFAPRALFEDHVLARVWRPDPEWVRNVRFAGEELVESGRIWLLIGAVTVGSLIPLAVLLGGGATFATEIGTGIDWLFKTGIPSVWTATASDISYAMSQLETLMAALPLSSETLRVVALGSLPVLAACTWGLSRTMRATRGEG
jgi:hypothetical protein